MRKGGVWKSRRGEVERGWNERQTGIQYDSLAWRERAKYILICLAGRKSGEKKKRYMNVNNVSEQKIKK